MSDITAEMLKAAFKASDESKPDVDQGYIDASELRSVVLDGGFDFEDIARRLNETTF